MRRENPRHLRVRIAQLAARLMAEHGISDHAQAKRKAARQLGIASANVLPSNEEIDEQVHAYLALFEPQGYEQDVRAVRHQALQIMDMLDAFDPILVGALAQDISLPHIDIELEIHTDSSKEFERFLLDRDIPFKTEERKGYSVFTLYSDPANVVVRIMPEQALRGRRGTTAEQLRRQMAEADASLGETS